MKRAFLLLAAGCALAAAAGGCGRRPAGEEKASGGEVLATVGRYRITRAELDRRLAQLPESARQNFATPERQAEFLDQLVEEKLIQLEAEAKGLDRAPEFVARLADIKTQLLGNFFNDRVLRPLATPDSAEVGRYYQGHPDEFRVLERVAARQIVVASEKEARALAKRLQSGVPFDSLLSRSIDPQTKNLGGALGYLSRGLPVRGLGKNDAFVEAVMAVPAGQVSEPIRTDKGYHLVKVEGHEPERVRDLESVRETLVRKLTPEKFQDLRRQMLDSLRASYKVKVDREALVGKEGVRQEQAKQLFERAQGTEDPAARIRIYEQILAQHGDSKYGAQAQFMIGFVYAEELKDKEKARAALNQVIEKYPKSELVDSARWMLKNMESEVPRFEDGEPAPAGSPSGSPSGSH